MDCGGIGDWDGSRKFGRDKDGVFWWGGDVDVMDLSSASARDFASRDALVGFSAVSLFVVIAAFLRREVGHRRTGVCFGSAAFISHI